MMIGWAKKQTPPLDRLRPFAATSMELVALVDSIHFYLCAIAGEQREPRQDILPQLISFQNRLIGQLEVMVQQEEKHDAQ